MVAESSTLQWVVSGLVSACGLISSLVYVVHEWKGERKPAVPANILLATPRPWRRVGAAIVALLSVMFFLGVNFIAPRWSPRAFALFWLLMLLLVLWLCALAWVDIRHTRRLTSERLSKDYAETMSRRNKQDKAPEERS